jgi:hypothetical protein
VRIAQIDEIGDRPGREAAAVERHGRGGLEQVARGDEDQFAARFQWRRHFSMKNR